MKHFYLYIFILSIFIIGMSYYNTIRVLTHESFSNTQPNPYNKYIILLGDSILQNNAYVSNGKSIESILKEKGKTSNIVCLAKDQSKIVDVYNQIDNIPMKLNNSNNIIFLSAGGNDILSHYVDQNQDITNTSSLKPMFSAYINIVKTIHARLPATKIVLLDVYYPDNLKYKQFHSIIQKWNTFIYEFADNRNNKIHKVIKISSSLTKGDDFAFDVEPSLIGGQKIADLILDSSF
jgi:hypothetical protein